MTKPKSHAEVRRVKERAEASLLQLPGVTGVDIGPKIVDGQDTGELAIRVYVSHKRDVPESEAIPEDIDGVPTDVVERRYVLR